MRFTDMDIKMGRLDDKLHNLMTYIDAWDRTDDIKIELPPAIPNSETDTLRSYTSAMKSYVEYGLVTQVTEPDKDCIRYFLNPQIYLSCLKNAMEVFEDAKQKGYEQGYKEGTEKARKDIAKECADRISTAIVTKLFHIEE